jgi:hypothetical protein
MNTQEKDGSATYSLHHAENYHNELEADVSHVASKLADLFLNYLECIGENIQIKNKTLSTFIVLRGLDTIVNVFNLLLLYTKNLNVTYFHGQKAFYYYIEFVGQISEHEKQFLQLTSRDATSYVYKKTIFDVPHDKKPKDGEMTLSNKAKWDRIGAHTLLYKLLISKVVSATHLEQEQLLPVLEKVFERTHEIQDIHTLYTIAEKLMCTVEDVGLLYDMLLSIVRKAKKNVDVLAHVQRKIFSEEFIDKQTQHPEKITQWLLN